MILNALMILNLFLNGVKAPGICDGFPCCNKPVNNPVYDTKGNAYGYENEQSCIVPDVENAVNEKPPASALMPEVAPTVATAVALNADSATDVPKNTTVPDTVAPMPVQTAAIVIPQKLPELPEPETKSTTVTNACVSAYSILINDLNQCYAPMVNQVYDFRDIADKISIEAVDCICATSHWRVGSKEIQASLKSACAPPGNLTKSRSQDINNGCSIFPYNYIGVIHAIGVKVRLSNGDSYLPLSQFSGSPVLMEPSLVIFAMISIILNDLIF